MYSHILWDFNGTILDDVGIGIESINTLLSSRALPTLDSREAYQQVFRFPIIDYYADLGLDVSDYDNLAIEWVEQYLSRLADAPIQPGVEDVLARIADCGMAQIILSATEQTQLRAQVEGLGIAGYFTRILGLGDIHARSKTEMALAWKREENPSRLLLIGDTDHDADTARALGADCLLLAIGHQSREKLLTLGYPVLDEPSQVLPYILGMQEAEQV